MTLVPASLREQHRRGFACYLATGDTRGLGKRVEMTAVRAHGSEFPVELAITGITTDWYAILHRLPRSNPLPAHVLLQFF